jgi:UDP-glucose 4-epimerase
MTHAGQRVVVTGGAGFVGSHLVDRLVVDGCTDVVVFDDLSHGRVENLAAHRENSAVRLVRGDVRDRGALEVALRGAEVVYHLAARSSIMGQPDDPEAMFSTNVVGTFNVLRAAAQGRVRRVVFASARDVYGEPIALPVDEDHPLVAINAFGASKAAGELYCRAYRRSSDLEVMVLRLANVYGPRDVGHAIPVWLNQAQAGQELQVFGGKAIIDFLWVGRAVEALVRAGSISGSLPPVNVASGTGTRVIDLARRIVRLVESRAQITVLAPDTKSVTRFVANVDRMRQMLHLEPPLDPLAELPRLLPSAIPAG